ncbi:MAG TPA: oligosaccharide flippase family protein [Terriglobales bacterium]|nr:oligosaccharide flippase family protein [Terriglobales bacterium]
MTSATARQLARKIFNLGSGEAVARLCGISTIIFLARRCGVAVLGVYALAQSMVLYSYPFIDFGLRHVGARLMAKYPQAGREIMQQVQRRRLLMGAAIVPFLLAYAWFVNLPREQRAFLFLFSAISCLYALSLEWAAWGKEHLRLVGWGRMIVPGSVLLFLLLGSGSQRFFSWMVVGNAVGYSLQGIIFWRWWRRHRPAEEQPIPLAVVRESLAWRRTSIMGLAWLCNLAFNTIDMLMLGLMSNAHEVGLYSAAYRVMNQVLFTYYLLTQALYPTLARQEAGERLRALRPGIVLSLLGAGLAIAVVLAASGRFVLAVVFGRAFLPATLLLSLLAWAIPLDFVTSYLSNAYIAWSMEKKVLACTAIAAGSNVILNWIWIPSYGATAAAANTLISYGIFVAALALAGRYAKELAPAPQPQVSLPG